MKTYALALVVILAGLTVLAGVNAAIDHLAHALPQVTP